MSSVSPSLLPENIYLFIDWTVFYHRCELEDGLSICSYKNLWISLVKSVLFSSMDGLVLYFPALPIF